jgi:PAS domain-containing protein
MRRDLATAAPLAEPLATWSRLIEAMLDAVWLVDATSLRVVAANHAAGELMATTPAGLVGQAALDLAGTPEDLCFWGEAAHGLTDRIESDTLVCGADGSVRAVTRRVSRVPLGNDADADAAAIFVVVLHDRSAQRRTERELEATAADLRATLESTHEGLLVTDLAGRLRNFNRRFASLWQIPAELLGRREDDAVLEWMWRSVVDPAGYMRRLAVIDDVSTEPLCDTLQLQSGRRLERVTMPHCQHGRPIGRVYAFRDITGETLG